MVLTDKTAKEVYNVPSTLDEHSKHLKVTSDWHMWVVRGKEKTNLVRIAQG